MTAEEKSKIEQKINSEIIDTLCPFIKSSFKLMEEDEKSEFTYAYLLSLATAIERLQKIIYVLKKLNDTSNIPDVKSLGHNIIQTFEDKINPLLTIEASEKDVLMKALTIITSIVTHESRYANFDFENNESFEMPSHLVQVIDENKYSFEANVDYESIAKNILHLVFRKYIAHLVDLVWNQKVNSNIKVQPLCLQELITKGYLELDINQEIQNIIDAENESAKKRINLKE